MKIMTIAFLLHLISCNTNPDPEKEKQQGYLLEMERKTHFEM